MSKPKLSLAEKAAPQQEEPDVPVSVADAWDETFHLAHGLIQLIFVAQTSDATLTNDALNCLGTIGDKLRDRLEVVNAYFNPKQVDP